MVVCWDCRITIKSNGTDLIMGFNIKNNYGPLIDNHDGGVVNLRQHKDGTWSTDNNHDAEDAEVVEEIVDDAAPALEGKTVTATPPVVQETFADRVKAIMRKAATKNGQQIATSAKGHAGAYLYNINAKAFCKAMDEMVSTYGEKLKGLLGGTLNCVQVTKVCFFIGSVVRMHVINDVNLQTVDMLFAFEGFYDNLKTVQAKLGDKKATDDQNVVLGYFEGLLRKYIA